FGEDEVDEVIADLRSAVAHQAYEGPPAGVGVAPAANGNGLAGEEAALLVQRLEQVERSVNRILPIVRKILYAVSERRSEADDDAGDAAGRTQRG
ncbi:MAG: hypothetical protein AB1716_24840, partial [Planctomycetota bacterium]